VASKDDQPIKLTSIFSIQKLLKCAVGDVKEANKLRNGDIMIEVKSKSQAVALSSWVDQAITVTSHRSLNTSRGIIRCRKFHECNESEVL